MRLTSIASIAVSVYIAATAVPHTVHAFSPSFRPTTTVPSVRDHRFCKTAFPGRSRILSYSKTPRLPDADDDVARSVRPKNPKPVLFGVAENLLGNRNTALATAAATAFAVALFIAPVDVDAAMSGGRMGGSFSQSRSSSPSVSRPAPSSYGSGGGYYGGGGYSTSRTIIAPTYSPIVATPGFGYSPYYYGGPSVVTVGRGPSIFDIILFGGIFIALASAVRSIANRGDRAIASSWDTNVSPLGPGTSLVQLSVGMEVPNRDDRDDPNSVLSALKRLSNTASTDSRVGIQSLTSQVALEILRRRSSIVSASASYKHYRNNDKALQDFQSRSVKERSKFEQEQVSKFGGVNYAQDRTGSRSTSSSDKATMAVITLLLAIDGDSTKVSDRSISEVEEALRRIAADARVGECLQSAEILWTPEDRSETLTFRDVAADYPELRSL